MRLIRRISTVQDETDPLLPFPGAHMVSLTDAHLLSPSLDKQESIRDKEEVFDHNHMSSNSRVVSASDYLR